MSSDIKDWCVIRVYHRKLELFNDVLRYEAVNVFNAPPRQREAEYLSMEEAKALAKFLNFTGESKWKKQLFPTAES